MITVERNAQRVGEEGGHLKDDPVGIVALADLVEGAGSQDTVEGQKAIVKQDAANAYNVVHVRAVADRAQQPQVHLNTCQYETHCPASDPLPGVRGTLKSLKAVKENAFKAYRRLHWRGGFGNWCSSIRSFQQCDSALCCSKIVL